MTNSERIQANNQELRECIDKANALPDSDVGFDRGYAEGYEKGIADGYENGYYEGLAARTYETWTITYVDGTVEEKEVALL